MTSTPHLDPQGVTASDAGVAVRHWLESRAGRFGHVLCTVSAVGIAVSVWFHQPVVAVLAALLWFRSPALARWALRDTTYAAYVQAVKAMPKDRAALVVIHLFKMLVVSTLIVAEGPLLGAALARLGHADAGWVVTVWGTLGLYLVSEGLAARVLRTPERVYLNDQD